MCKISKNFTIAGSIKNVKVEGVDGFIYSLGDECTITWDAHPDLEDTFGLVEIAYDLYGGNGYDRKPDSGDEFENIIFI